MMRTSVEVSKMRIFANHGVFEQERRVGNVFEVTVMVDYPFEYAMMNDSLDGTVSYADICDIIKEEMGTPSKLIEHAAWRIREHLKRDYPQISGGTIKITKITPPVEAQVEGCSAIIEW